VKKNATPDNIAALISAYIISDIVINPEEPIRYKESNLANVDSELVGNAELVKAECQYYMAKDLLNPRSTDTMPYCEKLVEE
jgi:hypothetical protein